MVSFQKPFVPADDGLHFGTSFQLKIAFILAQVESGTAISKKLRSPKAASSPAARMAATPMQGWPAQTRDRVDHITGQQKRRSPKAVSPLAARMAGTTMR